GANLKVGEQVDGGRAVDQGDSRAEETAVDLELDGTSGRRIAARGGGDGGGRLIVDGQGAVHVADAVVRINRSADRDDIGITRDRACTSGSSGQRRLGGEAGGSVAVHQPGVRRGQRRQCGVDDHVLVVGGDGQCRRGDGQGPAHVADVVVGIDRATGGD